MNRIRVMCKVNAHEIDGKEVGIQENLQSVLVENHWNWIDRVVITLPQGDSVTVSGSQLLLAVKNAMRTR